MKITTLIESLCLMFCIWSLRVAFLAAGCWMIYNGWYGCGLTTIIFSAFIGGKSSHETNDDKTDDEGEKE